MPRVRMVDLRMYLACSMYRISSKVVYQSRKAGQKKLLNQLRSYVKTVTYCLYTDNK